MAQVLNLNNEVVKMRKEVKKVRVLTVRRLTRHIAKLKAKKGTEEAVLKNHKRAQRLLEEIHAMKEIKLDQVTKLALGREINFELVCKKPNATALDRAIARLTTHPLLKTKIASIKAAVKAFKDARRKPARMTTSEELKSEEQLTEQPEVTQCSSSSAYNKTFKQAEYQDQIEVKEKPDTDMREKQSSVKQKQKMTDSEKKCPSDDFTVQAAEHQTLVHQDPTEKTVCPEGKESLAEIPSRVADESDSDTCKSEDTGLEKEYFDDSTEERFYNQSSDTDESDGNDDFFIGKVKMVKKKRAADTSVSTGQKAKNTLLKNSAGSESDTMQDKQGSYQSTKVMKLESVFYSSLSNPKQKSKKVKRTVGDHLPKSKRGNLAFGKSHPPKALHKGAGIKQGLKREQLEQPLHPSWEASRKRREQISQITAFQGKKIKFED
ncbi:serum response factor-binding protein 1 [Hemicordylus capensis]|uniref:serum response factor-binding protein 1 n=1 Tax=Hemicordylus capensis TaxID=884348 RepID=UPI002303B313|nr:serum response factor-binding protein 1 [Hemicordylus capensis]